MSLGLDFGTTTTVFSNAAGIITIFGQDQLIPSVALFEIETGTWMFGKQASDAGKPSLLITNLKSAITLKSNALSTRDRSMVFNADEVITRYLEFLANELLWDQQFGTTEVMMSCPAFWDKSQRKRLIRCATEAGFNVAGNVLLDEPVAAAVGWLEMTVPVLNKQAHFGKQILVFDMGGGTLDLALLNFDRKGSSAQEVIYQVSASCGSNIAGNAVDFSIASKIYNTTSWTRSQRDVVDLNGGVDYFLQPAREIKEALSASNFVTWVIPLPSSDPVTVTFSEEELKEILVDVFESGLAGETVKGSVQKLLTLGAASRFSNLSELRNVQASDLEKSIDGVLVVGGMARMPLLREYIENLMEQLCVGDSPEFLPEEDSSVQDVVALGLGQPKSFLDLNMMRPDFDIVLNLYDLRAKRHLGSLVVWEAYTMPYSTTYDPNQPAGFLFISKKIEIPTPVGYSRGAVSGEISIISHNGTPLRIKGAESDSGLYFRLSESGEGTIKVSSSGVFSITDEGGEKTNGQLQAWPEPFIYLYNDNYQPDGDLGRYAD